MVDARDQAEVSRKSFARSLFVRALLFGGAPIEVETPRATAGLTETVGTASERRQRRPPRLSARRSMGRKTRFERSRPVGVRSSVTRTTPDGAYPEVGR
jgi:hypothetical protein